MQFSGLDIDPVIKVIVGDQSHYTTIKKSSNNPFFNEVLQHFFFFVSGVHSMFVFDFQHFVFEFTESPALIFDKMITLRVSTCACTFDFFTSFILDNIHCYQAIHSYGLPGRAVLRAGNLLAGRMIGEFKCDVGTVYAEPGTGVKCPWISYMF